MIEARQVFLGRGGAKLPYDAEVEYLESTGTQYIVLPTTLDVRGIDCYILPEVLNTAQGAIGRWNGASRADTIRYQSTQNRGFSVANGSNSSNISSGNLDRSGLCHITVRGTAVTIAGDDFTMGNIWGGYFSWDTPFALFGCYNTSTSSVSCGSNLIGVCKILVGASLDVAHDLTPVRFTNEFGQSEGAMYDRANPTFGMNRDGTPRDDGLYLNRGTGVFGYGNDNK